MVPITSVVVIAAVAYGWSLLRRESQSAAYARSSHWRRCDFLLVPLLWGIGAAMLAGVVSVRLLPGDWSFILTSAAALAGSSAGLLHNDWRAPDGKEGWGRVAALWLGFALLVPGALAWSLSRGPVDGAFLPLAAGWVIFSALPFGRWELMDARQCMRFSRIFYGVWSVVLLGTALLPADYAGGLCAVGYLASPVLADRIRSHLGGGVG